MVGQTTTQASTDTIVQAIKDCGQHRSRVVVAIAGPPGSGKSTYARELATRLGQDAAVLPMDGFHLDNADLDRMGLLHRKGAPQTFDAEGFVRLVRALRTQNSLVYPTFDRRNDCTIADGGTLPASIRYVLIEGNYLLLRDHPWSDLKDLFDLTVFLDVSPEVLKYRLVSRWLEQGMDPTDALARAEQNDMKNVDLVLSNSGEADFSVRNHQ